MDNEQTAPEKPKSLEERLRLVTEQKAPGAKTQAPKSGNLWDSNDGDFEPKKENPTPANDAGNRSNPSPGSENVQQKEKPLTDKQKQASADGVVGMIELLTKTIGYPIIHYNFKKNFTEEEIDKIYPLVDTPIEKLEGESLSMRTKWDRLVKKQNAQNNLIKFPEKEKQNMAESIKLYQEFTGKQLSPGLFVACSILQSIGNRVIDVMME